MKVLDVYTKKDLDLITCGGKKLCVLMDEFFNRFPNEYRKNYDRNLETLEIQRVDEMPDDCDSAEYLPDANILLFKSYAALPHELMHVASSDLINRLNGICRCGIYSIYENGMIEGMSEFLSALALDGKPVTYFFECFAVSMISSIDGVFEPYFIPNYSKFISLFPNKKDILSLLYSLNFYHDKIQVINDDTSKDDIFRINDSVRSVIDSLIDIELSFNKNNKSNKVYSDKFMDLIVDKDIDFIVGDVYPDYVDYAYSQVKKRLLRR